MIRDFKVTGISIPLGGVSWDFGKPQKYYINKIFKYCYSKRVLTNYFETEVLDQCAPSIILIRDYITDILCQIEFNNKNEELLYNLIDICNEALDGFNNSDENMSDCLYSELMGYSFITARKVLGPFRQKFFNVIEKLENNNNLKYPKKTYSTEIYKKSEDINCEIEDFLYSKYDDLNCNKAKEFIFKLMKEDILISFIEIYKPIYFHKKFLKLQEEDQIEILKYINENYKNSTDLKMMKKYDIFALIVTTILRESKNEIVKEIANKIFNQCINYNSSAEELLEYDIFEKWKRK